MTFACQCFLADKIRPQSQVNLNCLKGINALEQFHVGLGLLDGIGNNAFCYGYIDDSIISSSGWAASVRFMQHREFVLISIIYFDDLLHIF